MTSEELIHTTVRLSRSTRNLIDEQVKAENNRGSDVNRSDILRKAIEAGLKTFQLEAPA